MAQVRKLAPSGLRGTKPMPSSYNVGSTSTSVHRNHSVYSLWTAASGCTAWARRPVEAPAANRPKCLTLSCRMSQAESGANVLRPAVDARRTHARDEVDVEVGLGVDHHLVPQRGQCLASGPKGNDLRIEIERDANPSIVKTHLDDVDEADLLKGKTDNSARDTFFYNSGTKPLAIRYKNWKMY